MASRSTIIFFFLLIQVGSLSFRDEHAHFSHTSGRWLARREHRSPPALESIFFLRGGDPNASDERSSTQGIVRSMRRKMERLLAQASEVTKRTSQELWMFLWDSTFLETCTHTQTNTQARTRTEAQCVYMLTDALLPTEHFSTTHAPITACIHAHAHAERRSSACMHVVTQRSSTRVSTYTHAHTHTGEALTRSPSNNQGTCRAPHQAVLNGIIFIYMMMMMIITLTGVSTRGPKCAGTCYKLQHGCIRPQAHTRRNRAEVQGKGNSDTGALAGENPTG
jgi:hypothetical protein